MSQKLVKLEDMIEGLVGNKTCERVLIHVYYYGSIHASAIAKDYSLSVSQVLKQLERLEKSRILKSQQIGRSRIYFFDLDCPFLKPLKEILKISCEAIPLLERCKIFKEKRRFSKPEALFDNELKLDLSN